MSNRSRSKKSCEVATWETNYPVKGDFSSSSPLICGVPIDRSKTFNSIDAGLTQRKKMSYLEVVVDKFYIETGLALFEPWEKILSCMLFVVALAPAVYWMCVLAKVVFADYILPK